MSLQNKIIKLLLLVLNYGLNYPLIFRLIGKINRKIRWIKNIFIAYPANQSYARSYAYQRFYAQMKWTPWIAALLKYNESLGIMMVISGTEDDFHDPKNRPHLKMMVKRVETVAQLLGVSQVTFAGILPGILYKRQIRKSLVEADITINAILESERQIQKQMGYSLDAPIIIIGSKGFIGSQLAVHLKNRPIFQIDSPSVNLANTDDWPDFLKNKIAIVINISRKCVLRYYIHLFWKELIIINDVYPEPSNDEIQQISKIGCSLFHITGIKGCAFPPFPGAYKNGLPCCSTYIEQSPHMIITKLC